MIVNIIRNIELVSGKEEKTESLLWLKVRHPKTVHCKAYLYTMYSLLPALYFGISLQSESGSDRISKKWIRCISTRVHYIHIINL